MTVSTTIHHMLLGMAKVGLQFSCQLAERQFCLMSTTLSKELAWIWGVTTEKLSSATRSELLTGCASIVDPGNGSPSSRCFFSGAGWTSFYLETHSNASRCGRNRISASLGVEVMSASTVGMRNSQILVWYFADGDRPISLVPLLHQESWTHPESRRFRLMDV